MQKANEIAWHPKVKLHRGPSLDTRLRHEEMLVLRLFGVGNPGQAITRFQIIEAMPAAFLKADGKPRKYPKVVVSEREGLSARAIGG